MTVLEMVFWNTDEQMNTNPNEIRVLDVEKSVFISATKSA